MNRKLVIGCLVAAILGTAACGGVILLSFAGIMATTQPAVTAADEFLILCSQGKVTEAYQSSSVSLQAAQDEKSFAFQVRQLALDQYESSQWISRSVVNDDGTLEGQFKGKNGLFYDATIRLVKESGKWRVAKVRVSTFEMPNFTFPSVPSDAEIRKLVKETVLQFDKAIRSNDIDPFYATISDHWKKQITSKELGTAFQDFIAKKIDLSPIGNMTAKFDPVPSINENAFLEVSGKYISDEGRLSFQLKYILEGGGWKLVAIDLRAGKE